jgi:hypothetical protein
MSVKSGSEGNFMDVFTPIQTSMDHKFTFKSRLYNYTLVFWGVDK